MRYAYGVTTALLLAGSALTLTTGFPAGAQVAQNEPAQMQTVVPRGGAPASFADLTQQLQPAVVNISTRQRVKVQNNNPFAGTPFGDLFGGQGQGQGGGAPQTREAQSLGSGFIVSADGYVVTNNHVITAEGQGEIESITVTMTDGTDYPAKLIGRDAASDLAVLKITGAKPFPFVKFGDSRHARVGDWIIAIGNPFGLGGTVTSGIISAVYRNTGSGSAYDRYLQTDASINRGNSGGPMFDMQGNVIGINNAKNRGEFIQSVEPGQGAAKAGMQPGDVVVKVDGKDVTPDQTLSFIVANTAPGKRIPIDLIRNGQRMTVQAVVGKRPSEEEIAQQTFDTDTQQGDPNGLSGPGKPKPSAGPVVQQALGIAAIPLTAQIARQLGASEDTKGVVITAVDDSADAATKGLQRGDIVLSANYKPVMTAADQEAVVRQAKAERREAVLLRIQRRGQPAIYLPIRIR